MVSKKQLRIISDNEINSRSKRWNNLRSVRNKILRRFQILDPKGIIGGGSSKGKNFDKYFKIFQLTVGIFSIVV